MARPRVFVSSTYYDLKHIRSSVEYFVQSLGFESILSEKGEIAFTPNQPLDESCYREAASADLFVLVIGGRYGSEASPKQKKDMFPFFERYDSITKKEYESASGREIPTYILIERGVYSEYQTYLMNKGNENVSYAHVDSVNIFRLIEEILSRPKNNPVHTFDRFADIESWLREQWAGLFRELLHRQSQHQQLLTLTSQVAELKGVSGTLKTYLEALMRGVTPDDSKDLIQSEEKRLEELRKMEKIRGNFVTGWFTDVFGVPFDSFISAMRIATSFKSFVEAAMPGQPERETILETFEQDADFRGEFNEIRDLLGVAPIQPSHSPPGREPRRVRKPSG